MSDGEEEEEEEEDRYVYGGYENAYYSGYAFPPQRALHRTFKRLRKLRHPVHPIRRGSCSSSPPVTQRLRAQTQPISSPSRGFFSPFRGHTTSNHPMEALVRMAEPVLVQWFSDWLIRIYNNICLCSTGETLSSRQYPMMIMFPVLDSTSDGDCLTTRTSFSSTPKQDRRLSGKFGQIHGVCFGHFADDDETNDEGDDRCGGDYKIAQCTYGGR
ncbi:hypothetical protein GYMLUDRAFT_51444 [Collybiopsis luxurians FD-317 M1]|uniref:Uncharacterized protein n=1 Tax=Collybiopsis luxurians FD-317 M1 TaxID=944289 RepID=A0A0D0BWQ6_9AGAR|nr:hypothetical protein GYMLUDRAFT_51444 [Collybiopsis luxurians FD-317 M1]